jgi:predicted nucleic acid-binding protein
VASGRLKPEERVKVAVGMVDVVTQVSAENEKMRHPGITQDELIHILRRRFRMLKAILQIERAVTDSEDIKAILETTPVRLEVLRKRAREQSTVRILDKLLQSKHVPA